MKNREIFESIKQSTPLEVSMSGHKHFSSKLLLSYPCQSSRLHGLAIMTPPGRALMAHPEEAHGDSYRRRILL